MNKPGYSTKSGFKNKNEQINIGPTECKGNDHGQKIYVMECKKCGFRYGANGSDIFQRKCPRCDNGERCSNPQCSVAEFGKGNCDDCVNFDNPYIGESASVPAAGFASAWKSPKAGHAKSPGRSNKHRGRTMSGLPYDPGNAGDLIKHGALAVFVEWFLQSHDKIRFADPFGGLPSYDLAGKEEICRRMSILSKRVDAIASAQPDWERIYYGSSGVVWNIARRMGKTASVFASDEKSDTRDALMKSGVRKINEICKDYIDENGYSIFECAEKFDFILIDPFSDLLCDDFSRGKNPSRFQEIKETVGNNPKICIAVFVLDMEDNPIHDRYCKFKESELSDMVFSLRCPKIKNNKVRGESKFNTEILLISERFREKDEVDGLTENLKKVKRAVESALNLDKDDIEFCHPRWD